MPPPTAYAAACIELYSRLWLELEALDRAPAAGNSTERHALGLETLRLELVLVSEACDSIRWRALLAPWQRLRLRITAGEALRVLGGASGTAIAAAQDVLCQAMLAEYAAAGQPRAAAAQRRTA